MEKKTVVAPLTLCYYVEEYVFNLQTDKSWMERRCFKMLKIRCCTISIKCYLGRIVATSRNIQSCTQRATNKFGLSILQALDTPYTLRTWGVGAFTTLLKFNQVVAAATSLRAATCRWWIWIYLFWQETFKKVISVVLLWKIFL